MLGNILIVQSDLLTNAGISRLESVNRDCGFAYSPCQIYCDSPIPYRSYTVISFGENILNPDLIIDYLNDIYNPAPINGYFIAIEFANMVEIYSMCISVKMRGKGIMTDMLKKVADVFPQPLWVGVGITNPMFDSLIRLYVKSGFDNPSLVDVTPHGVKSNSWFVSLTQDGTHTTDPILYANFLKNYTDTLNFFRITVKLSGLRTMVGSVYQNKEEWGGIFKYTGDMSTHEIIVEFDPTKLYKGEAAPNFVVQIPNRTGFIWHTHPAVCYTRYCIAWPSAQDMFASLVVMGELFQIVMTLEGMYTILLNPFFKANFFALQHSIQIQVATRIKTIFQENDDVLFVDHTVTPMYFLNRVNNVTLNTLLTPQEKEEFGLTMMPDDFMDSTIYQVQFIPMNDVKEYIDKDLDMYLYVSLSPEFFNT